jgi:16S rRNA (cytidine1402-2'-O)-methyltransferase
MCTIYLIPNFLAPTEINATFPNHNIALIQKIQHFFVEEERNARRFLKKLHPAVDFSQVFLYPIGKYSDLDAAKAALFSLYEQKKEVGILSESGYPCVADPGSELLAYAHQMPKKKGLYLRIEPLVGPSSMLMALAASGLNGQRFTFHGYLPIDKLEKTMCLKKIQSSIQKDQSTHLFIETPFRNDALLAVILDQLHGNIRLCIARELMSATDMLIQTDTLSVWRQKKADHLAEFPVLHKKNCIFLLGA